MLSPLPVLLLVSRDRPLVESLVAPLSHRFSIKLAEGVDQATAVARQVRPWGVVADFRDISTGGHAETKFLEVLEMALPETWRLALVGSSPPEPLARQLACQSTPEFRGAEAAAEITAYLMAKIAEPIVTPPAVSASVSAPAPAATIRAAETAGAAAPDCDFTLAGLTRRFETNTPRLRMMLSDLEVAARHDVTILLIGETGSGKTYLSRLVHEISPRREEPFLPLACGALPADLIESELFGHVKGAFTSAHADKDGKFVAARRGTILLDEIDVVGLEQQVKLLRVIESGEFEPVGSNRTLRSEARLIVASNLDLQPLVEQKRFRPDLYYRLNMLKFEIPPLRARRPDIVPLARKFIREQSVKHGVAVETIDESLFTTLLRYPWPGNVRELEHVIQRAVIYCRDGRLTAQHLPSHIVMGYAGPSNEGTVVGGTETEFQPNSPTLGRQVAYSEREIIEQALFQNNDSRTNTARALGISRVTLYNKMKKYGISK